MVCLVYNTWVMLFHKGLTLILYTLSYHSFTRTRT